jgi:HEAT repeat protein
MIRLVTTCLLLLLAGCDGEPTFEGKPRSYWLAELNNSASTARMRAAHVLGQHAAEARQAIPELIKLLDDDAPLVRWMAAEALGKFGAHAHDAAPALKRLAAEDPEFRVRDVAGRSLQLVESQKQSRRPVAGSRI